MKLLQYEDIPRWYSLFWDFDKAGLFIKIHTFFLEHTEYTNRSPYFSNIENEFNYEPLFDSYEPNLGRERFGLNDSITLVHTDENWLTYRIKLPKIKFFTGMTCPNCDGTGKRYPDDKQCDDVCIFCAGTKKESTREYGEIRRVCYSLRILLTALSTQLKIDVPTSEFQLFTITSSTRVGHHGHSVGGRMSPVAVNFLETFSDSYNKQIHLPEIEKVMALAHEQICGEIHSYDFHSFRCYTSGGHIVFSCPGNACYIQSEMRPKPLNGEGGEIYSHNLDGAIQQLTLLSGLAALSTLFDSKK